MKTKYVLSKLFNVGLLCNLIIVALTSSCSIVSAQSSGHGGIYANFGVDGDLSSSRVQFPNEPGCTFPSPSDIVRSDDWFSSGFGIGRAIIDTNGAAAFKTSLGCPTPANLSRIFSRNFNHFETYFTPDNHVIVLVDALAGRDWYGKAGSPDQTAFTGSSNRNIDNPGAWTLGVATVGPERNDIVDVGVHMRRDFDGVDFEDWVFFFATTMTSNGDSHLDFECFRNHISYNAGTGQFDGLGNAGGHRGYNFNADGSINGAGDFILVGDYANGGTQVNVSIRIWIDPNSLPGAISGGVTDRFTAFNTLPGIPFKFSLVAGDFDAGPAPYYYATILPLNPSVPIAYSRVNSAELLCQASMGTLNVLGPPWGSLVGAAPDCNDSIQALQLVELAINFGILGLPNQLSSGNCESVFGSFLVKTRSSASFTSELNDFMQPLFLGITTPLQLQANGGTLDCNTVSVNLCASAISSGPVTVCWEGPSATPAGPFPPISCIAPGNPATQCITVVQQGFYRARAILDGTCFKDTIVQVITLPQSNCGTTDIIVNQNVTVDFNVNPPAYAGDPDLQPFFSFTKNGVNPDLWKAIFNTGNHKVIVTNGATITTTTVNGSAPGIVINGNCELVVDNGAQVIVRSTNKRAGNILLQFDGNITINGEIRDELSGTTNLPGAIKITSKAGNISIGQTGKVFVLGTGDGGNSITIQTCGIDCDGHGDITVSGLVKSFANGHSGDQTKNRMDINVVSLEGKITINANTNEPLYDEFQNSGTNYDLYGGLLSWVRDNAIPGKITVQAKKNIAVFGHGVDPTGPVRRSFGAIASIGTSSSSPGGIIDVRSIDGSISGDNRSFDVSGRNRLVINHALIHLQSKGDIMLTRSGSSNSYNPVVDASSPGVGDKGGRNELRSNSGAILVGANALVSAAVPAGSGSVQGINLLTSCTGVIQTGIVVPADLIPGDDAGICSPSAPGVFFTECINIFDPLHPRFAFEPEKINSGTALLQNKPNPFRSATTIGYRLGVNTTVRIDVIDLLGNIIATPVNSNLPAGDYEMEWKSDGIAEGIYYLLMRAGDYVETKKLLLLY